MKLSGIDATNKISARRQNESDWKWLFLAKMAESARIHYVENETSYELVIHLTFYLVIHIFRMSKPNGNGQIC